MKIIDWYIIKKYLFTFVVMILLFIPIGIMVDIAEKIDKFKENEVPADAIFNYYIDFTWYFGNLLFPIFLFLSVIWFTSKLANNTEITAILSSGVSFSRFLRPYLISAGLIAFFAFFAGMFVVPKSNSSFNEFIYKYLDKKSQRQTKNLYKQINPNEYIFVSSYDPIRKSANNFTLEHFEDHRMTFKIQANSIRWVVRDSVFRLSSYVKRTFHDNKETYKRENRLDTIFDFKIDDLAPVNYKAETLTLAPLNKFIEKERQGGSVLINSHLLVRHKRWSLPISAFVLTLIGVSVSSFKRRGGMGVNLAFGISLGFLFIFFDKIFSVMVNKSDFSPFFGAWLPVFIFGVLAIYLVRRARS
ncbi:MAG: YjgP/YjgQ family permease [Flavobacteriales bacterium TMED235]|nr:MAG: YjgP/YjgQ family permease [Flavobacteriales bacterium TMED235]|tara:strand:+ start:5119 stop:6192 length:1074 start_codon:yes stop_codon:yes gene_type:complete